MGAGELEALMRYVSDRYARSGQPADVIESLNRHNDRVLSHVEEIARGEGLDDVESETLKTISILHDAAKADTHLMLHAEAGAEVAAEKLRELGKSEAFIEIVQGGIRCHMGPFPFVEEEAKKYAERTGDHLHFPRPQSKIEQLFYDADMLALIDVDGIEKVVVLRSTTPQFIDEDEQTATAEGGTPRAAAYRSAMQSVKRAADTLFSETARHIAGRLMDEAAAHVAQHLAEERAATS
jgi:HD domain-containing protein